MKMAQYKIYLMKSGILEYIPDEKNSHWKKTIERDSAYFY